MSLMVGLVESGVRGTVRGHFRTVLSELNGRTPIAIAAQELDALFKRHNLISATKFRMVWLTCSVGHREFSIDHKESGSIENGREYNVYIRYDVRNIKELAAEETLRRARILAVEGLLFFARKFDVPTEALVEYRKPLGELRVIETYGSNTSALGSEVKELSIEFAIEGWGTKADAERMEKLQKLASKTLKACEAGYCSYSEVNPGVATLALQVTDVGKAVAALASALAKPAIAKDVSVVDLGGNTLWSRE